MKRKEPLTTDDRTQLARALGFLGLWSIADDIMDWVDERRAVTAKGTAKKKAPASKASKGDRK